MLYEIIFRPQGNKAVFFHAKLVNGVLDTRPETALDLGSGARGGDAVLVQALAEYADRNLSEQLGDEGMGGEAGTGLDRDRAGRIVLR